MRKNIPIPLTAVMIHPRVSLSSPMMFLQVLRGMTSVHRVPGRFSLGKLKRSSRGKAEYIGADTAKR
jgi:hypothetical protein